jgi:hypothetical protein
VIGLEWLAEEYGASEVLARLLASGAHTEWRQLAVLDSRGQGKTFTGACGLGITATALGIDCVAAGNLLANEGVPQAMTRAFETSASRPLAERLLLALETGIQGGGERGPVHSAGLQVSEKPLDWPAIDLRVDWSDAPVADLRKTLAALQAANARLYFASRPAGSGSRLWGAGRSVKRTSMSLSLLNTTLDLLGTLVQFDTTSHHSNLELIEVVGAYLTGVGAECQLIGDADRRKFNLYGTIGPTNRSGLCLSGHTDVVPINHQPWTAEPFALTRRVSGSLVVEPLT